MGLVIKIVDEDIECSTVLALDGQEVEPLGVRSIYSDGDCLVKVRHGHKTFLVWATNLEYVDD